MSQSFQFWLSMISWISFVLGIGSFIAIVIDEYRYSQSMGIMNVVWPITALYQGFLESISILKSAGYPQAG